jgi:hypothetical protein
VSTWTSRCLSSMRGSFPPRTAFSGPGGKGKPDPGGAGAGEPAAGGAGQGRAVPAPRRRPAPDSHIERRARPCHDAPHETCGDGAGRGGAALPIARVRGRPGAPTGREHDRGHGGCGVRGCRWLGGRPGARLPAEPSRPDRLVRLAGGLRPGRRREEGRRGPVLCARVRRVGRPAGRRRRQREPRLRPARRRRPGRRRHLGDRRRPGARGGRTWQGRR